MEMNFKMACFEYYTINIEWIDSNNREHKTKLDISIPQDKPRMLNVEINGELKHQEIVKQGKAVSVRVD